MPKTLYLNIEDDYKTIAEKIKSEMGDRFVLVVPRKAYLFSDSVNLKLLKKQLDVLGKQAAVMTMDEKGQAFAHEAGFKILDVPRRSSKRPISDIKVLPKDSPEQQDQKSHAEVKVKTKPEVRVVKKHVVTKQHAEEKSAVEHKPLEAKVTVEPKSKINIYKAPELRVSESIFDEVPHKPAKPGTGIKLPKPGKWLYRLLILAGISVAVAVVVTVVIPKATIYVTPESDELVRQVEITSSTEYPSPEPQLLHLPAEFFETDVNESGEISTLGKRELGTKSSGMVRIFNLTPTTLNLKASTTTLINDGKQYILNEDAMYIPALSAKQATAPNAGFLVRIEASGFGENYNLKAGDRLIVENQVFGSKPDQLYAIVEDDILGGSSRFISEIQEMDMENAKQKLIEKAMEKISQDLKLEGKVLPEDAYNFEVTDFSTDQNLGTETTVYNASLKGKIKGVTFKPEELQAVVRTRVEQVLPSGNMLQSPEKDKLTFKVSGQNLEEGNMKISVYFESRMFKQVDLKDVSSNFPGSEIGSVLETLKSRPDIEDVSVEIFPKQRKTLPILKNRLKIEIREL